MKLERISNSHVDIAIVSIFKNNMNKLTYTLLTNTLNELIIQILQHVVSSYRSSYICCHFEFDC